MTTYWKPDTCKCYANVDTKTLIDKCNMHNTYAETLAHNQSFNTINEPNDKQIAETQKRKYKSKQES